jgi:hypothetical protein
MPLLQEGKKFSMAFIMGAHFQPPDMFIQPIDQVQRQPVSLFGVHNGLPEAHKGAHDLFILHSQAQPAKFTKEEGRKGAQTLKNRGKSSHKGAPRWHAWRGGAQLAWKLVRSTRA